MKICANFLVFFAIFLISQPIGALAADPAETVLKVEKGDVVWSRGDQNGQQVYFSTYQRSKKAWTEPVKITDDTYRNGHPVVDAASNGTRVLVWTTGTGSDYIIRYAVGKNDNWSAPAEIPSQLKENLSPSVVVDKAGVIWVVWSANDGGQDDIYYARNAGDGWSTPLRVNSGGDGVPDILPVISLNAEAVPQVTWKGYRHDAYVQLQSTWNGEGWSAEVELETTAEKTAGQSSATGSIVSTKTANNAAVANMPAFIDHPERAFLRVYKSSVVK
jgi:hypothetical protein